MRYTILMKSYGIDFRKRVINYVEAGHSKKETCQLFGISTNTLYLWEKQLKEADFFLIKNILDHIDVFCDFIGRFVVK